MNLFKQEDTIVALATGNGKSALATIRISGKFAKNIVSSVFFDSKHNFINIQNRTVHHGYIYSNEKKLDEVILIYMKAPNTYTGEDTVEISTHGNMLIVQSIIELLLSKNDIRLADKGEFTYRSFINNKMDLSEAEAVYDLINSNSNKSIELALNSLQGALSSKIKEVKEDLIALFAYLEVSLDYPEEDIDFLSRDQKKDSLQKIISKIDNIIDSYSLSKIVIDGIKIAIVGKPNAGKSSILNCILGYQRSIVTDIAGTTTDTIEEKIEYKGIPFTIVDTAGIRCHSSNPIEKIGQERTKSSIDMADIILWVIDSNTNLDSDDSRIVELINNNKDKVIVVLNKSDLKQNTSLNDINKIYPIKEFVNFSSIKEIHIENILSKIFAILSLEQAAEKSEFLLNTRQYDLICKIKTALNTVLNLIEEGNSDEIVSFETQNVLVLLNEILGCDVNQDILHIVFSKFCVGK
ncbi:MAG: tRNA uridine-5-carboxymethylaminomethyl(34) synthesis GTPase MnmE [Endomicrobiia bacterium]|nr:tRNA uridine-5-carboxymethylaminomethyl(34) synthesis GTPase MnmE [Endomicrobiaceae bacterium]MDD3922183.1 tRNA uridine-5-carboxymethylaminomethyl(34) synthesis GTPase MnmE [Endomicrobiaceae bacterium]